MKIGRLNDNCNKVKTKEQLLEFLKEYRGILTEPILDYLKSLINLDFSVIKEYISDSDRKALAELEIYKRIAIYNIYNKALNLFNEIKMQFNISSNDDGFEKLDVSILLGDKVVKLFNFDYSNHLSYNDKIPKGYKTMNIGNISLYQTLENKELRKIELNRVLDKLEKLYDQCNSYTQHHDVYVGTGSYFSYQQGQEIAEYERRFTELDSKKELSDFDKREIEITNQIRNMLLEDYGLTDKSFEENMFNGRKKSVLHKTLVKKQPNLTIANHIKYI